MSKRNEYYQYALILLGLVSTIFFGVFFYRELFPEYKIYQEDYVALEKFRSSYTHEPPPDFQYGVKQILLEKEDKGNPNIDRCISCHVALRFEHFSPTKLAKDVNGNLIYNDKGIPVQIPNDQYVWARLDEKVAELTDTKVTEQLKEKGDYTLLQSRLNEAEKLKALKTAHVGHHEYDVTKVLRMHPLIGRETRPFEFHPMDEYGCISCHSGNGRGLTTEKAHGPVFDGEYEEEFEGEVPRFTEIDPENDPQFSRVFNHKPGYEILFQTTPIFTGALIQAKCVQCHQPSSTALQGYVDRAVLITEKRAKQSSEVERALQLDKESLVSLLYLDQLIKKDGYENARKTIEQKAQNYSLTPKEQEYAAAQYAYFKSSNASEISNQINQKLLSLVGSKKLVKQLQTDFAPELDKDPAIQLQTVNALIEKHRQDKGATGDLFAKLVALDLEQQVKQHIEDIDSSFTKTVQDQKNIAMIASDIDLLTYNYQRGQKLFIAQACYACHRIAGLTRGGVGPELTQSGNGYPWFIKQSIVWPQADLKTSTMPNFQLDHEELEDLVTFLLGQVGETKAVSKVAYRTAVQEWEAGRKQPWEKPITPLEMQDLNYSMKVFAVEGCASCHRLKGFEANVGFRVEKENKDKLAFDTLFQEKEWFKNLIPEQIAGSVLVEVLNTHSKEIDQHIVDGVREKALLNEIDSEHPDIIESYYTPFKFASRAKNAEYQQKADAEKDPANKKKILDELQQWKDRVRRVMLMYAQEYGLGRLIGPRPNWSGVFRTDEWLMEHFKNPQGHVPRSIMPVFPFDETKFYALTHMLDVLGIRNRDEERQIWENRGFNPELAFQTLCSQCHGEHLGGNGPVATWIYPIPKNLRNADFLRNLTKERAIQSITYGVIGTPMPPWGVVAEGKPTSDGIPVLTRNEIIKLVDWMYTSLPGGTVIRSSEDVLKWQYTPENVIKELEDEGNYEKLQKHLQKNPEESLRKTSPTDPALSALPTGDNYFASLKPQVALNTTSTKAADDSSSTIFEKLPNPLDSPDKYVYYIKKEYYTPENIEHGRLFFELNCAVCHGKDADGSGMRAGTMIEAKPRMLINIDWSKTRDDLRLLRSIKYGVPGTAMTPWGDLTSSLQRIQLVMFIRSLTQDRNLREELAEALYSSFSNTEVIIERARASEYPILAQTEGQYFDIRQERENLYTKVNEDNSSSKALEAYQKELDLMTKLNQHKRTDSLYVDLKKQVKNEKDIYQSLGLNIIQSGSKEDFHLFVKLVNDLAGHIQIKDDKLSFDFPTEKEQAVSQLGNQIIDNLSKNLKNLEDEKAILQGRIPSAERNVSLQEVNANISSLAKLKNKMISGLNEGIRIRTKEKELIETIQKDSTINTEQK